MSTQTPIHIASISKTLTSFAILKLIEANKIKLLGSHWVMIQPSLFEGWGLTVIEANGCGTPVIASRVNGLVDSIVHLKTGLLFDPKDTTTLEKYINQMITNHDLRKQLSENSYKWSEQFTWNASALGILGYIQSSLKNKKYRVKTSTTAPLSKKQYGI